MSVAVQTRMTDEEFFALPEAPGKQELLEGELIALPPASDDHNYIVHNFYDTLSPLFPRRRVRMESGFRLERGWLQPDVSVLHPDQQRRKWYEGAPMIAIEIASRGNTDFEIDAKIQAYLAEGAAEVWIVRPQTQSMTVYKPDGSGFRFTGVYQSPLLPSAIDIREILTTHP